MNLHIIDCLLNTVNLVAVLLMLLSFDIILDNIERNEGKMSAQIYIYIAGLATALHVYQWKITKVLTHTRMCHLSFAAFAIAVVFAIITELFSMFGNDATDIALLQIRKSNKNIAKKLNSSMRRTVNNNGFARYGNSFIDDGDSENMELSGFINDVTETINRHSNAIASETGRINRVKNY